MTAAKTTTQGRIAVPDPHGVIAEHLGEAPPGHVYRLYWRGWGPDWQGKDDQARASALEASTKVPRTARDLSTSLVERHAAAAKAIGGATMSHVIDARTTAPLVTGMGAEHPNENGFAFLDPYGLPYLPGSSVKGALRSAAEWLARGEFGETSGWNLGLVWYFFGFDATAEWEWNEVASLVECGALGWLEAVLQPVFEEHRKKRSGPTDLASFLLAIAPDRAAKSVALARKVHFRGALVCFDALFSLNDGSVGIDIMNPHHKAYYEGNGSPHDAESPVPIKFLVVEPGTRARFAFALCPPRAPAFSWERVWASQPHNATTEGDATAAWKTLLDAAWDCAANYLGLGAKTAVGYGRFARMRKSTPEEGSRSTERPPIIEASEERWERCTVKLTGDALSVRSPDGRTLSVDQSTWSRIGANLLSDPSAGNLRERLKSKKGRKKGVAPVTVFVRTEGNKRELVRLEYGGDP